MLVLLGKHQSHLLHPKSKERFLSGPPARDAQLVFESGLDGGGGGGEVGRGGRRGRGVVHEAEGNCKTCNG